MIELTVLVPAYNEETTILGILERVGEQKIDGVNIEVWSSTTGPRTARPSFLNKTPAFIPD